MALYFIILVASVVIIAFLLKSEPAKIRGIYSEPGKFYWLKYWMFYCLLSVRQNKNRKERVSGEDAGYGKKSKSSPEEMEVSQKLPSDHPKAVDAVYFNGGNSKGYYLVAATARRHNKLTQTLLYCRIPELGLLEIPSLPDTNLYRDNEMEYAANGLNISPIKPMKEWRIVYKGKMRLLKSEEKIEEVDVSFQLTWKASTNYFDFDTDLNVNAMSDSMGREKWSRELFDNLRSLHQTHYEQFGEITGTIHISKYGDKEIKVQGVRDHSYGNIRDWKDLHRYTIQYIYLENGTNICVGNICMPQTMSRLIIGNIFHPNGKLETVSSTDINLYALGEDGIDPDCWEFNFIAGDKNYNVKCEVVQRPIFYMGYSWEARIIERMCRFNVNGINGWGISEWDYHNKTGRPKQYKKEHEPESNV